MTHKGDRSPINGIVRIHLNSETVDQRLTGEFQFVKYLPDGSCRLATDDEIKEGFPNFVVTKINPPRK